MTNNRVKMKEIQNVDEKLSCEQESPTGSVVGGGGVRTGTKT